MAVAKNVQYLADYYKVDAKELARLVRELKDALGALGFGSGSPQAVRVLRRIDQFLGTHGVEYVQTDNGRWSAYYANSGDTYRPTVMIQTRPRIAVIIGRDWGSYVERYDYR